MKVPRRKTVMIIGLALLAFALGGVLSGSFALAEHPDVATVLDRLDGKGIPIKASALVEGRVEITLESASSTDVGTPDDPIFISRIEREFQLAKSRGLDTQSLRTTVVNSQGDVLSVAELPLEDSVDLAWMEPSELEDSAAEDFVWDHITEEVSLVGVSLDGLEVGSEDDGTRILALAFSAQDEKTANQSWADLMVRLYKIVNESNFEEKAQIGLVRVDLVDESGMPLFRYLYDVQRANQSWWQSPGMTTDWFETP
jgi:hypothetical protein